jgi:hypothetical protein
VNIFYEYSHLGGREILQVRYPETLAEIYKVVSLVEPRTAKISKEKTKKGRNLVSPIDLNSGFKECFDELGYHELRDTYTITMPGSTTRIPGAYKQVDFVKDLVLVEVQFGKYAFMFYDMAKFQYFFNENKADVGVEIVPCHNLHHRMSSGVSYGEQLVYDIERLKRHFPAVPVLVILIDSDLPTPEAVQL